MDINEFFREVTLRLCRNLEIEEGLRSCIEYLANHMPADRIYLQRYDGDFNAMRIVARADEGAGEKMDVRIPLPEEAMKAMQDVAEAYWADKLPPVITVNDPDNEPVTRYLLESLGEPLSSAMSLPLVIEKQVVGTLVLLAEGNDRYNDDHVQLYSMLKEPFAVALSNTLKYHEVLELQEMLADNNRYLNNELRRISGDEIIGMNFGLKDVMHRVKQVAGLDSPVLLLGETGSGKDVIANAIHYSSPRHNKPFIKVNCGAIPDTLIDSELFGHEKGAFTGAIKQKRGYFERADKGTIFLDEIGELPLQAQVRLLRVLQDRQIERVGGTETLELDIRIVAATNKDLKEMVGTGDFREDLYFRLNVFPIYVPPLRERKIDIPALVQHFIMRKTKELKLGVIPKLDGGAIDVLLDYDWPGNVRELANIVERALILYPSGPLVFDNMAPAKSREVNAPADRSEPVDEIESLDEVVVKQIKRALEKTNGKIHGKGGAAELLGINPNTLRSRMQKLGIESGE